MINLIHRTAAFIVGGITLFSLFLIVRFPSWIMLGTMFVLWMLVVAGVEYVLDRFIYLRRDIPILSIITMFAIIGLLLLAEWEPLRLFLMLIGTGIIALLHAWVLPKGTYTTHLEKSYRRMVMMLWVFNCYAIITLVFAVDLFFQGVPFWLLSIIAALVFAFVSYMVWRLYYAFDVHRAFIWMSCIGIIGVELMWVFSLLPFAYTVLGLFVTWIWYVAQLFFRFHFSGSGIMWRKQTLFLTTNVVIFILLFNVVLWR